MLSKWKILVLSIAAMFVFAGCGGSGKKEKKGITIALSLPTQQEERWVLDKEAMEKYAKEKGAKLLVAVANADVGEQIGQIENLLAQNPDVLIIAPTDGAGVAPMVDKANADGVPVIAYDRLILNSKPAAYLSFDNEKVGEIQGEFLTKAVPQGNYIIMSGAPTDNNAGLFKKGAMKFIQPLIDSGAVKVITDQAVDNWEPKNALVIVENALTQSGNKVDGILAPNDNTAGAAIVALKAQGLAGKVPVTGQDAQVDAARRILAGTQSMTVFKDTRQLAKEAIDLAIELAKKEKIQYNGSVNNGSIDVPAVLLKATAVTKDNLQKVLVDSGYLKSSDLK